MPNKKSAPKRRKTALLPVTGLNRKIAGVFAALFIIGGSYLVWQTFAGSATDYPASADQLVVSYTLPHEHQSTQTQLSDFFPNSVMLYGNGLLLCGGQTQSVSQPYYLHSTQLNPSQITGLITSLNNAGWEGLKDSYQADPSLVEPDEMGSSVILNLAKGAKEVTYFSGTKPSAFARVEQILVNRCSSVQTDYTPDGVVLRTLRTAGQSGRPVKTVHGLAPSVAGAQSQIFQGAAAQQVRAAFGPDKHATLVQNGQTYDATLTPVIPSYQTITANVPHGVAYASSVMHLRWYWFYGSDQSLSSYNSSLLTIRNSVHSFFTNQIYSKSSTYGDSGTIRGQQTAAWYRGCHTSSCGNSDYNSYVNIQNELKARGYVINNQSVSVLAQWGSAYGSAYCSGLGGSNGTVYGTSQGFGVSFGEQSANACQGWAAEYQVPAHEEGHTFGLGHTCNETGSLMDSCDGNVYSWPGGYHVSSSSDTLNQTEKPWLNSRSLAFNQEISGRVYNGSTGAGISGASIYTCNYGTITTNSSGYFYLRIGTKATFCLRVTGGVSGTPQGTGNNSEHANAPTYEYQMAGYNCYHNSACNSGQYTWDRSSDTGYNFKY